MNLGAVFVNVGVADVYLKGATFLATFAAKTECLSNVPRNFKRRSPENSSKRTAKNIKGMD